MAEEIVKTVGEESIKLTRGQRGGYGWEIKLLGEVNKETVDSLVAIDQHMKKEFLEVDGK